MPTPFELTSTYVHLRTSGDAVTIPVDDGFWAKIGERTDLHEGYLITRARFSSDWPHWEMHPEGEELVVLLSGRVDLINDDGERETKIELHAGQAWLNPRGVWHRAIVHEPGDMLFVTAGRGTQHRPL